jgi:hypothetical protein
MLSSAVIYQLNARLRQHAPRFRATGGQFLFAALFKRGARAVARQSRGPDEISPSSPQAGRDQSHQFIGTKPPGDLNPAKWSVVVMTLATRGGAGALEPANADSGFIHGAPPRAAVSGNQRSAHPWDADLRHAPPHRARRAPGVFVRSMG